MATEEKYDGVLLAIAQSTGNVDTLVDNFFSFLARKSDFYSTAVKGNLNFQEEIVLKHLRKNYELARRTAEDRDEKNRQLTQAAVAKAKQKKERQIPIKAPQRIVDLDSDPEDVESPKQSKGLTPNAGNGSDTPIYSWNQKLNTLDISIPVANDTRARDVRVTITNDSINVTMVNEPPILKGKLDSAVKAGESTWTLVDGNSIQITLEKVDNMKWWSRVIEGETEIDTRQIVPENSKLADLDPDTRATVEKMMYDQKQQAAGLPTSDQSKQAKMLDSFKSQHPELDFSKCKINWGGEAAL